MAGRYDEQLGFEQYFRVLSKRWTPEEWDKLLGKLGTAEEAEAFHAALRAMVVREQRWVWAWSVGKWAIASIIGTAVLLNSAQGIYAFFTGGLP